MRELLIFSPFNIIFVTFIVIVVIGGCSYRPLPTTVRTTHTMPEFQLYMHADAQPSVSERGEAEKIRFLLAETGFTWDDVPVDAETFKEMCSDGTLKFGKLPALVDTKGGDKYIEGSNMCMQVIASRADAAGKGQGGNKYCGTPTEFPYVGAIAALVNQFEVEMNLVSLAAGAPANAAEVIQKYYTSIDAELRATDDDDVRTEKYLTGKNLTYADITAFAVINGVAEIHGLKSLRQFPKLKEFHDRLGGRPRIEARITSRAPLELGN